MSTINDRDGRAAYPGRLASMHGTGLVQALALTLGIGSMAFLGSLLWGEQQVQQGRSAVDTALHDIARQESVWFAVQRGYATLPQLGYPVSSFKAGLYTDQQGGLSGSATAEATYRITLALDPPRAGYCLSAEPIGNRAQRLPQRSLCVASGRMI